MKKVPKNYIKKRARGGGEGIRRNRNFETNGCKKLEISIKRVTPYYIEEKRNFQKNIYLYFSNFRLFISMVVGIIRENRYTPIMCITPGNETFSRAERIVECNALIRVAFKYIIITIALCEIVVLRE